MSDSAEEPRLTYRIERTKDDDYTEWVATVDAYPSLSWIDTTPDSALSGLIAVLESEGLAA